ncbi:MAG: hypothetical protein ABW220_11685 [Burkholderiaceae bacterium]
MTTAPTTRRPVHGPLPAAHGRSPVPAGHGIVIGIGINRFVFPSLSLRCRFARR